MERPPVTLAGRPSRHRKPFRDAMRMELATDGDSQLLLREICSVLIEKAKAGDIQAIRDIRDTLDGKPAQLLEHSGPEGRPIERIIHEIVYMPPPEDAPALIEHPASAKAPAGYDGQANNGKSNGADR